ncbi:hypothetical protein SAMN06272737_11482 [Blastococcus mobilis]|uniref:Uncharacterized protein n=1 Tax=Blastococcus mobilis TaxID=1938746 RepID=A0A238XLP2_9ACTN|nr:hypothetical protein SAMN06272737_11482 [Blastococcus mobilis]
MASRSRPAAAARSSTCAWVRKICSPRTVRGSGTPTAGLRASRPSRTARPRISDSTRWAWRTVEALFPDLDTLATQAAMPWWVMSPSRTGPQVGRMCTRSETS